MFKDRIKELRRIPAKDLLPNPKNWRTHPAGQRKALQGILSEIGYADALIARELPGGQIQLLDGHLRAKTSPNQEVPVLIVDLDEKEADQFLAVFDPLTALAQTNQELLGELIGDIETENQELQKMLESLSRVPPANTAGSLTIDDVFQILITCKDETEQQFLYEKFAAQNIQCKIINL